MEGLAGFLAEHEAGLTLWAAAICTFAIFSLLYKENAYYRLFEHIFIGLATGQGIYIVWSEVLRPKWWDNMVGAGQWWWAFALPAGLMFYFIYSRRNVWISRVIFGILMGLGVGLAFQGFANIYFPQIEASFKPLAGVPWSTGVNNGIFVVVLVTVMAYFFFSIDHKAPSVRRTAALGRWFLMFAFGALFGSTVMARMSLFIGRLDFLLNDWGPIVPAWFWIVLVGICALAACVWIIRSRRRKSVVTE